MRRQQGQSLLEVLMVAGLMGILMVILVGVSTTSIDRNREAERRTVATRLAQEGVEWLSSERDRVGWMQLNLLMGGSGSWCLVNADKKVDQDSFSGACKIQGMVDEFTRKIVYDFTPAGATSIAYYEIISEVDWPSNEQSPVQVTTRLYKDVK
jgi:type II secretory pathway pseudopilin PulG